MSTASKRVAGLLLHPTSLPGGHGIGDLGPEAYRFVDFLVEAGQGLWQVMPLGPPGYGESPYAARSAFAGNPLLISLDRLVAGGLLKDDDLRDAPSYVSPQVDFAAAEAFKLNRLGRAFVRFRVEGNAHGEFAAFRREHAAWLDDYSLFMALRDANGPGAWTDWPPEQVRREPVALEAARAELEERILFHTFVQFLFFSQWRDLRRHAEARGIHIIGDLPIYVAQDSADVWAHQDLFLLDEHGRPLVVAGVPPDDFSATGQLWGNPLYRWDMLAARGFDWWIERFRATRELFDLVRVDHFRGFQASWHVPAEDETAEHGRWVETPGAELFTAVRAALGDLPVIAEDLGVITPAVEALRDQLGLPGMKVLQFAFSGGPHNPYLPHNHPVACLVYTGTHDNDTTTSWYISASGHERDHVRRYFGVDGHDIAWDMIRHALASVAETAIVPVQDILKLGGEARMNYPGRPSGNWAWRLLPGQLTADHAYRLRGLTEMYGRTTQRGGGTPPAADPRG